MQNNKIIATAKHPRDSEDIIIYEKTWTDHALLHEELKDCGMGDCLNEVVETLNNPNIIREGRNPETEELFVRYTTQLDFGTFEGFSVSTRTDGNRTFMTTAYHDIIQPKKGKVIWTKGASSE
jgi:hypothetical protein